MTSMGAKQNSGSKLECGLLRLYSPAGRDDLQARGSGCGSNTREFQRNDSGTNQLFWNRSWYLLRLEFRGARVCEGSLRTECGSNADFEPRVALRAERGSQTDGHAVRNRAAAEFPKPPKAGEQARPREPECGCHWECIGSTRAGRREHQRSAGAHRNSQSRALRDRRGEHAHARTNQNLSNHALR
jgi:hypothetical protein